MHRSLILAPATLGDSVASQPLVEVLARQGQVVSVAATPLVAPVYRAMGKAVAEVVEVPFLHGRRLHLGARRDLGIQWRRLFDVAYCLSPSVHPALIAWFAQVPRRVGYPVGLQSLLLNQPLRREPLERSAAARFLALAAVGSEGDTHPRLERPAGQVEATCARHSLSVHGYWVIVPGAQEPSRAWPAAHYARLARELHDAAPAPVVLLGSADEADLAEHIAAQCPEVDWRQLSGRTSLNQALDLLAGARAVLGNDSGPIHLAAALGRPQVSLFGPTDPTRWAPVSAQTHTLWARDGSDLPCAPCERSQCRRGDLRCMQELAPQQVLNTLLQAAQRDEANRLTGSSRLSVVAPGHATAAGDAVHGAVPAQPVAATH